MITEWWKKPVTIERNHFKHKSLSVWSCNVAVGCGHGCTFCYVPKVSTNRMASVLRPRGVEDSDEEWGNYVFPRPFDEKVFLASLRKAEAEKPQSLNADGNRAVMFCTTTDPYQVVRRENSKFRTQSPTGTGDQRRDASATLELGTRRALELILEHSSLNVRMLTRSPLARQDFDLMKAFGNRLTFGMSLPTLDNDLARIYEPKAPAPSQRLETLRAAKAAGLHVFAAVAPAYPDCSMTDLRSTLAAVAALEPVTVFMEPLNIRGGNVKRIEDRARALGRKVRTEVFAGNDLWAHYAWNQLNQFELLARQAGIGDDVLHLWPDETLMDWSSRLGPGVLGRDVKAWLEKHWGKVSAWPGTPVPEAVTWWVPPA
jgi:DNA repair photolyase